MHTSGAGWMTYNAENKISQYVHPNTGGLTLQPISYTYNADGRRVEINNEGSEGVTKYIYGLGGELLYETGDSTKHYGYRNGEMLVTENSECTYSGGEWFCGTVLRWLVPDHLGTPRMVVQQNGTITRHDYLPFGEEIGASIGGRSTSYGYSTPQSDGVRQQFTSYERDTATGLDFAQARYFGSSLGRFTSPDPENAGAKTGEPQSWNGYAYVGNNPTNLVDPDGLAYLRKDNTLYWVDDAYYNKNKDSDEFKGFTFVPYGTIVNLGEGQTGRYAGLDGQDIRLLPHRNFDVIPRPGEEPVTVFADRGPVEPGPLQQMLNGAEHRTLRFWRPAIYAASPVAMLPALTPLAFGVGGSAAGGGILSMGLSNSGNVGTAFSVGQLVHFQRILAQGGRPALERSLRTIERRLAEHISKEAIYGAAGGYTSSVVREVANFKREIAAIKFILGRP